MLDDACDVEVDLKATKDAETEVRRGHADRAVWRFPWMSPAVGFDGAGVGILGEHGGGDADIYAAVEEIVWARPKRAAQATGTER